MKGLQYSSSTGRVKRERREGASEIARGANLDAVPLRVAKKSDVQEGVLQPGDSHIDAGNSSQADLGVEVLNNCPV